MTAQRSFKRASSGTSALQSAPNERKQRMQFDLRPNKRDSAVDNQFRTTSVGLAGVATLRGPCLATKATMTITMQLREQRDLLPSSSDGIEGRICSSSLTLSLGRAAPSREVGGSFRRQTCRQIDSIAVRETGRINFIASRTGKHYLTFLSHLVRILIRVLCNETY